MPCRVRKEVWLEPRRVRAPQGLELEKEKNENYPPPYFQKKSKISVGGGEFVLQVPNTALESTYL